MTVTTKLATLFATGSLLLAGASAPVLAASRSTDAFVANVHPNVDFLNDSSRLALSATADPRVRAFARGEAIEQTITGNSLVAWTETNTSVGRTALGAPSNPPLAPIAEAANVASNVTTGVDDVLTGRSVAIDTPLAPVTVTRVPAPDLLLPSGEADMARLSKLRGHQFDAFYKTTQTDALRQLATLYSDYIRDGDDPALRAMAAGEFPKVKHRLALIRSL